MNNFKRLSYGIAVIFVLAFVGQQGLTHSLPEDEETRPIVEVTLGGDKYTAPVYEDVEMTETRRKFDRENVASLLTHFSKLVDVIIVRKRSHFFVARATIGIVPAALNNAKAFKLLQKSDSSPAMAHGYCAKMGDLIYDILDTRTSETIEAAEAQRRAEGLIGAINGLAGYSKVGMYLDWTKFKVNGKPVAEFCAPLVRWFKENGYGMELKLFEKLASVAKKYSSTSERSLSEESA